jgi:DNA-directed RNA polymerase III subunit RPC1
LCNIRLLLSIIDLNVIVLQPIELWTGKQLFSVLVRPHAKVRVYVNLTVKEKSYTKPNKEGEREKEAMCPNDGLVYFRNSELLSGQLGKATLGQLLSLLVDSGFYSSSHILSLFC